jgi:hypothetical protein
MMDNLMACETRYREHHNRVAQVDTEAWRTAKSARPAARVVARMLVALAVRLDKTVAMRQSAVPRAVVPVP